MPGSPQFPKIRSPEQPQQSRVQDGVAGQLAPIASAVARTPLLSGTLPVWTPLSLVVDFTNSALVNEAPTGFHKDALGYVHLQGRCSTAAGVAAGFVFTTLPQGFRPRYIQYIAVAGVSVGVVGAWLVIRPTGTIENLFAFGVGGNVFLSGSFLADG